jgi:PilZ domain
MSASKLGKSDPFRPVTVQTQTTRLSLSASAVQIRKNGIEFQTATPIPDWTEMTVVLETPFEPKKIETNGVVVACKGNRHTGYTVSMVFLNLSLPDQARLQLLAFSTLA